MLHFFNLIGMRFGVNTAWRVFAFGIPLLVLLAGAAAGAWLAWTLGRADVLLQLEQARTERAELHATHSETARLQALAAARGLQDAQARGNALSADLLGREAQIDQLTREKIHAINRLTTGRACLGAAAVRVLNQPSDTAPAGLEPVPETPSGAAATGGAFATDADVGNWAATARAEHEICRARLAALIGWHATPTTGAAQ